MTLKTTVKVGRITNLSDARYCAGMGVDLLGFNAVEGQPDYIGPIAFQELRGWFAGPKVVIEIYGITQREKFETLFLEYQPDMIELSCHELLKLRPKETSIILSINPDEFRDQTAMLRDFKSEIKYLQVPSQTDKLILRELTEHFPVLLDVTDDGSFDADLLKENPNVGLSLKGSPEEKTGYKNYSELANVLEQLEEI